MISIELTDELRLALFLILSNPAAAVFYQDCEMDDHFFYVPIERAQITLKKLCELQVDGKLHLVA